MTNSKNSNLEDVSKGNDESAPGANDSASNKKTRFTKSKSISEVFKELEFEEDATRSVPSEDFDEENLEDKYSKYDFDDDSVDEIIPIHNEYRDLDKSEALADESIEGAVIINPDLDDSIEANVYESTEEYDVDLKENTDSIDEEDDSLEFSESIDSVEDIDEEGFIVPEDDNALADEDVEEKIGKSSAQGVLINDKDKTSDSDKSLDLFNSSTIISIVGFIVGLAILLIGITYYASSSDRVVDNVLSGETAGLAIFLVIIGLIIIGFSLLKFFSSSKSSLIIDTFNSIKSIDYDEVSEDVISREDFDAVFSIFKRKKDTNFSDNDESVDSPKDLFENDQDELSEEDINSLYSESNLTSQRNQSSSKKHENANSTENSEDYDDDDGIDEIIPIHSRLNEQSSEDSLDDEYSKYDFDDDSDEEFDLVDDNSDDYPDEEIVEEDSLNPVEEDFIEDDSSLEADNMDGLEDKYSKYDFDEDSDEEIEETAVSKPEFKKSVDISKFEKEPLSEEELAEEKRIAHEKMLEKKRRIIEGTNFDNSLRKQ